MVLLEHMDTFQGTLDKILDEARQSYIVDGMVIRASLSIGWAVFPKDAKSLASLSKKADEMMYSMKKKHKQEQEDL